MAAATTNRPTSSKVLFNITLPVKAGEVLHGGTIGASDASGLAVPATLATGLKCWGKVMYSVDNSTGANGAKKAVIALGREVEVFLYNNDATTPVTAADVGGPCYALDDQTVTADSTGASIAGTVYDVTSEGVFVAFG